MTTRHDTLEVLRSDPGAIGWLRNSLKHASVEANKDHRRCLAYAGSPTMVLAHQRLAVAHKAAAEAYSAALSALDAKGEG